MKSEFWEYYPPTAEWFERLWATATIVLDSSVLLDLYKYSQATLDDFMSVLESLAGANRLWLPYHVGVEYQSARPGVVSREAQQPYKLADDVVKKMEACAVELDSQARHAYLNNGEMATHIRGCVAELRQRIQESKNGHPNHLREDPIQTKLSSLYEGHVGPNSIDDQDPDFVKDAKARYQRKTPPGFEDEAKEANRYGDLIIWRQVMEHASSKGVSIVLVTNDSKADWWSKIRDQTLGPHVTLRREFAEQTGHDFYAYSANSFLEHAKAHLGDTVSDAAIAEVRERHELDIREGAIDIAGATPIPELDASSRAALQRAMEKYRRMDDGWVGITDNSVIRRFMESMTPVDLGWREAMDASGLRMMMDGIRPVDFGWREAMDASGLRKAMQDYQLMRETLGRAFDEAQLQCPGEDELSSESGDSTGSSSTDSTETGVSGEEGGGNEED